MKKFLLRLSIFGLLFCLFCLGNKVFNEYVIQHHSGDLAGVETLIIGDSQIEHGLNPDFFPNSANVAKSGEPYLTSFYKLQFLLAKNPTIKKIFIGLSPHNLTTYNDTKFKDAAWAKNQFEISYPFLNLKKITPLPIDAKRYWQTQFRHKLLMPKLAHEKFIGKFIPYPSSDLESSSVQQRINAHYYQNDTLLNVSRVSMQMLSAMVDLCLTKNVEPIFIATPLHPSYREKIPQKFINNWKNTIEELEKSGKIVLDFSTLTLTEDFYLDYNHVNAKGADILSAAIAKELE